MTFNINDIISQVNKNYLAKPYLYEVRIFGGSGFVADAKPELTINCSNVSVPGLNLGFAQDKRYGIGTNRNYPTMKSFTEMSMTFYETEKEQERMFFVNWMDKIYDKTTRRFNYYRDYVKYVTVTQFDKKGNKTYEAKMMECWPSNISPLDKSYGGDSVPQFNVNMQFHDVEEKVFSESDSIINSNFSIFNVLN